MPKHRLPEKLWRVYKIQNDPEYYATTPLRNRWDPPSTSGELFGTCYTSVAPVGAFIEAFAELPTITTGEIDRRALAEIELPPDPRWANMIDDQIAAWGLDVRISTGEDYETCSRWAEALFAVDFTGVLYQARHNASGVVPSVALFGNPGVQPTQLRVLDSTPIPDAVIAEAEQRFGLQVWPSTPLSGGQSRL